MTHAPQKIEFIPNAPAPLGSMQFGLGLEGQEEENPKPAKITYGDASGTYDVTHLYVQQQSDRQFTLVEVQDHRYGDRFSPPKMHLGATVNGRSPMEVGQLALNYLEGLISSAKELSCRAPLDSKTIAK